MQSRVRLLARPRWVVLGLVVLLLVVAFIELSQWQLRRHEERTAANAVIEANRDAKPVPAGELMAPGEPVPDDTEWRPIVATGSYDAQREVFVRYRELDGEPGFHVLTPLVTEEGPALLVNRGWVPRTGSATELPDVAAPPSGEVQVTGRLRVSESGDPDQVRPGTGQIRYIDVPRLADSLPYPVYGGYAELLEQQPPAEDGPVSLPPPELDQGPHLSYAVQWILFAVIAVGGVGFLVYDALHGGQLRERLRDREQRHRVGRT